MSQVFSDGHRPQVGRGARRRYRAIGRVGPGRALARTATLNGSSAVVPGHLE